MSKIAVTGANGVIGSKLCEDLARDHELVRIDIRGVDKVVDVGDLEALQAAVAGCETLIHLAKLKNIEATWEETQTNIAGTYNAFEAARRSGCKRVIFASSNHAVGMYEVGAPEMYEPKSGTLMRVDIPFRPDSLYGVWKAFGETLGRYYSDEYGLQVACVRIGNIRRDDTPAPKDMSSVARWLNITEDQKRKRTAAVWQSQRDFALLVRAILGSDVPFGVVYGVSANATRFWDLEEGRALYGFWPVDGVR